MLTQVVTYSKQFVVLESTARQPHLVMHTRVLCPLI